jgi:hypothetical protein
MSDNIRIRIRRVSPHEWEATGSVRLDAGGPAARAAVTARASTRADAAARTLRALDAVAKSPLVRSMLPPGAAASLEAARAVASGVARLFARRRMRPSVSAPPPAAIVRRAAAAWRDRGVPEGVVRLGEVIAR